MSILECQRITKRFEAAPAVDQVSFTVERGEFFSLLGPSGCGKTTTLRLVAGLEDPDAGAILIGGRPMRQVPAHERGLGMVFQHYALFPHLSVERNVAYGLERRQLPRPEVVSRVHRALELVKLDPGEFAARRPADLSGGERQRVALARAIVVQPELLLLDEPLGALDLSLRKAMQLELKALNRTLGITFLYVTHDQEEALTMSDRLAVMHRGAIVQIGAPPEIYERPRTAFVARFLGESNVISDGKGGRVSVRPERIELLPPDAEMGSDSIVSAGRSRGNIEEVLYQGERVRVGVVLGSGERLVASIPNDGRTRAPAPVPGAPVAVRWGAEDAWPLEADQ